MAPLIELSRLTKRFGDHAAVSELSLEIAAGEIVGFLGPNGAGKTTTVKILAGLLRPSSGTARVAGCDVTARPLEAKRALGLVPDEPFVYPKLTCAEYLRFIGDLRAVPQETQARRIPELLEMFELSAFAGELLESYSHGMRQKAVLAGVLLHEPKVLLLDEPLVGLDPKSARLVKEILKGLAGRGCALLLCTHVLEIAEKICDRIAVLVEGRLKALGTLAELRSLGPVASEEGLEDIFLSLTGGGEFKERLRYF